MAKGRFLSRSISTNEQLAGVSFAADYLFTRCIPHLDVEGRMSGNPTLIKAQVVPLRPEITAKTIPKLLEELAAAVDHTGQPLVVLYDVGGQTVLMFPGFGRQQQGLRSKREAPSRFPPPSGERPAVLPPDSGSNAGSTPGVTPDEGQQDSRPSLSTRLSTSLREVEVEGQSGRSSSGSGNGGSARDRLLALVPDRTAWTAELNVAGQGMHGPPLTDAQIEQACRDYLGNGAVKSPSLRHFRAYLRDAARPVTEMAGDGTRKTSGLSEREALERWAAEEEKTHA